MDIFFRKLPSGCGLAWVCLLFASALWSQAPAVPNRVTQAPESGAAVALPGNVHPLARREFDRGPAGDALEMDRILLLLKRSEAQEDSLRALLEDQQDRASAGYHRWLSPEEFASRFGPSDADLQAVTDWLAASGFHGIRVASGRTVLEFSGSSGQVQKAFGVEIRNYAVNGALYVANASDPQIPAALAPVIRGIVSLHNFPKTSHQRYAGSVRRERNGPAGQPLFTFPDPYYGVTFYALGPADFARIYNSQPLIAAGNDGTGQTIAVVGETQINPQDVADFRAMFGLSNNFSSSNIVLNGMDPGVTSTGEEGESDLDVEWSGAVAPGAAVKLVVSASTPASAGIDLSALYIVEHNLADVMSLSYGACEKALGSAGNAFYNSLWEQAAAQGITVAVSSGDGGSAGCDDFNSQSAATEGIAVSGLSGTPFNVSVGGTDFNQINQWSTYWDATNDSVTGASAKGYIPEIPWNDNCSQLGLTGCGASAPDGSRNIVAAGGGPSTVYGKPKWQMGVAGVPNDNHRDQPDISLFASNGFTGSAYLYCQADTAGPCRSENVTVYNLIGGTSASAPAFAGVMALANQYQAAHGGSSRQGNPNYVLYALAKKSGASCASSASPAATCIFNDTTRGNSHFAGAIGSNSVPCEGGSPNCSVSSPASFGVLVQPGHASTEAWTAAAGYDMATGLGSFNVANLVTSWGSVSSVATSTTLSLSPTTGITHGQGENVSVTVHVTPNTGTGIPSGDVALLAVFADGSTEGLDQFTLANGAVAALQTQNLPGGSYKVYAHYAGDGTNAPSDSAQLAVTVGKEASQTFIVVPSFDNQGPVSGNASTVVYGSPYIIRMYVTNGAASASATGPPSPTCAVVNQATCPTGSVSLTANAAPVDGGTFVLNNDGYTRDLSPFLTGGSYSLTARYSGDSSYLPSQSAAHPFTVTPAPSRTDFNSTSFYTLVGQTLGISVATTVNVPGGVAPTGTFAFTEGGSPVSGTVSVSPGVSGGFIDGAIGAVFNTVGRHAVTATYSGDANYASSTTATPMIVYAQYPTTVSISSDSTSVLYGKSVHITAKVTSAHATPAFSGSLSFYIPFAGTMGPVATATTVDGSGNQILTATFSFTPEVSAYIEADFGGDANYASGSNIVFLSVTVPDFAMNLQPAVAIAAGQAGSTSVSIQPATNNPTSVALSCAGVLPNGYSCSFSPPSVALANGAAATSQLTVSPSPAGAAMHATAKRPAGFAPAAGTTGPPSIPLAAVYGALVALLLAMATPRRFGRRAASALLAAASLCLAAGCGGGSAAPPPGGGGNPAPTATSLAVSTSSAKVASAAPVTFTATISGQGTPTGNVTFFLGGIYYGEAPVVQGTATFSTSVAFPGLYTLTASYPGDAKHLASNSPGVPQAVTGSTLLQINAQTGPLVHSGYLTVTLQ